MSNFSYQIHLAKQQKHNRQSFPFHFLISELQNVNIWLKLQY